MEQRIGSAERASRTAAAARIGRAHPPNTSSGPWRMTRLATVAATARRVAWTGRPIGPVRGVKRRKVHGLPLIGHSESSLRMRRKWRRAWWRCDRTVPAGSPS